MGLFVGFFGDFFKNINSWNCLSFQRLNWILNFLKLSKTLHNLKNWLLNSEDGTTFKLQYQILDLKMFLDSVNHELEPEDSPLNRFFNILKKNMIFNDI